MYELGDIVEFKPFGNEGLLIKDGQIVETSGKDGKYSVYIYPTVYKVPEEDIRGVVTYERTVTPR